MSFNIVSTPIGNLEDISDRAIKILRNSEIILCEKKARALKLLNHCKIIPKLLIPYHDDKFLSITKKIIKELNSGKTVSLISDAGTPLISDPGHKLISELIKSGIEPVSIPGPCSVISALTLSGMDISNFIFLGFLPKRKIKILEVLKKNLSIGVPVVIFANSKTLKLILHIIKDNFDGTYVSISKEISKINEKTISGSTDEILRDINNSFYNKGEFVLIAKAQIEESVNNSDLKDLISFLQILKEEDVSFKKSVEILNKKFSISKKIIYSEALKMWDKN
tara:strand:- start:29833 stop:30672 length:840 start_codon:yes stop_codon:yes gene_type:complete